MSAPDLMAALRDSIERARAERTAARELPRVCRHEDCPYPVVDDTWERDNAAALAAGVGPLLPPDECNNHESWMT